MLPVETALVGRKRPLDLNEMERLEDEEWSPSLVPDIEGLLHFAVEKQKTGH